MLKKRNNVTMINVKSPDSVVQMSILLAYYRLYGKVVCAYEPVLTKRFLHGRTEAMRSTTVKTAELCAVWAHSASTKKQKMEALKEATQHHSKLVKEAADGKGVDRHLYALKCIAEKNNLPVPAFFSCKAWKALNHTVLSTSNCGNPAIRLFGFGPVVDDGFGIGYIIKDNGIQYSISSKHRQTRRYANTLEEVLTEIGQMLNPLSSKSMGYHSVDPIKKKQQIVKPAPELDSISIEDAEIKTSSRDPSVLKIKKKKRRGLSSSFLSKSSYVGRTLRRQSSLELSKLDKVGTKLSQK